MFENTFKLIENVSEMVKSVFDKIFYELFFSKNAIKPLKNT